MKRRDLIDGVLTGGASMAAVGAGLALTLGLPERAPEPAAFLPSVPAIPPFSEDHDYPHRGSLDVPCLTGGPALRDGQSVAAWWAEFHDNHRFEDRLCQALMRYEAENWANSIPDRITFDGAVYSHLIGFRNDGTTVYHPAVGFGTAAGDAPMRHKIGCLKVVVYGEGRRLSDALYRYHPYAEADPLWGTWSWESEIHQPLVKGGWVERMEAAWNKR